MIISHINELPAELLANILRPEWVGIDASFVCKVWYDIMLADAQWKEVEKKIGMPHFPRIEDKNLFQNLKIDWWNKTRRNKANLSNIFTIIINQIAFPVACGLRKEQEAIFGTVEKRDQWEAARSTVKAWRGILNCPYASEMTPRLIDPVDSKWVESFINEVNQGFAPFMQEQKDCFFINLAGFSLTSLPDISAAQKIENLVLSNNLLTKLSDSIKQLKNLTVLDLCDNLLSEFPDAIFDLRQLRKLNICQNPLLNFPNFSQTFPELDDLSLGGGMFEQFPEGIDSPKLTHLFIQRCKVDSIPVSIQALTGLRVLTLQSMNIKNFPEAILGIHSLTSLNLNQNEIEKIPEDIKTLTKLTEISMDMNKLQSLPVAFEEMIRLVHLCFRYNRIESVSEKIFNNSGRQLYLEHNPLNEGAS